MELWQNKRIEELNTSYPWSHKYKIITCQGHYHIVDRKTGLSLDKQYKTIASAQFGAQDMWVTEEFERKVMK